MWPRLMNHAKKLLDFSGVISNLVGEFDWFPSSSLGTLALQVLVSSNGLISEGPIAWLLEAISSNEVTLN